MKLWVHSEFNNIRMIYLVSAVFVCITPQEPSASLVVAVESANSQARPSCCKAGWTFGDRSLVKVYEFFNPAKSTFEI